MAKIRQIKSNLNTREKDYRKQVAAATAKNPMMKLGADPVVSRNILMEKTWKTLLADPPISHSDVNQWRPSADVRPSSFPFCPRQYVMIRLGLTMPSDFAVESNYYTEIGKAVHYVVQNALAATGRLWGFWLCARPTCGKRNRREYHSSIPSFFPYDEQCSECKATRFEYEELTVSDAKIGLRGHVDGIICYTKFSSVLEVKTSGDDKVEKLLAMTDAELSQLFRSESPWYGYWHQASSYAALLRMKYPSLPPIKYVDFMIHSRDNPKTVVAFRMEVPEDNSWYFAIRARVIMAQTAKTMEIIPRGFANNQSEIDLLPTCKWCTHKEVCLQPEGRVAYKADALYDKEADASLVQILKDNTKTEEN